jgi:hypothetical protein
VVICRYCSLLNSNRYRVYYEDRICRIIQVDNSVLGIYKWHSTPKPRHFEWVNMQMRVIASKRWDKEWGMEFDNSAHPIWKALPKPGKVVKKRDKVYEPMNKTKEVTE